MLGVLQEFVCKFPNENFSILISGKSSVILFTILIYQLFEIVARFLTILIP